MAYFRLNDTKTKEENLQLAKEYSDAARELLAEFEQVLNKVNKEFKPEYGLSPAKEHKEKEPTQAYQRLRSAVGTYNRIKSTYESRERMERERADREKAEQQKKQLEAEKTQLVNQAIKYCLDNGRQFGDGLSVENAIQIANDIAFNKEVERREAEEGDDYIDFEGQNCEDPCEGWKPREHRCQCGNRRVSWEESWNADFRDMSIYPAAY